MQVTIRKTEVQDAKAIATLHKKVVNEVNSKFYSPEQIKEWIGNISEENVRRQFQNSDWIVAEVDGKIVGFGQYSVSDGEINQINVDPDYFNQNIGKGLYDYMENDFRTKGVEKICLNSTLNATEFYQKLGFGIVQEIFFKHLKMMRMEKFLRKQK